MNINYLKMLPICQVKIVVNIYVKFACLNFSAIVLGGWQLIQVVPNKSSKKSFNHVSFTERKKTILPHILSNSSQLAHHIL